MNKLETTKLFALISSLYPREAAFANASRDTINAWTLILEDVPFSVAQAGLQAHVSTSPFPPSIAEIKGWAAKLDKHYMDAGEAWGIARKAVSKYGFYNKLKAKENTPADVWAVMERMGYEDMCMSENPDVTRGQFCRMWDARSKQQQELDKLPPTVRNAIAGAMSNFLLEG